MADKQCDCGVAYSGRAYRRHFESNIHQAWLGNRFNDKRRLYGRPKLGEAWMPKLNLGITNEMREVAMGFDLSLFKRLEPHYPSNSRALILALVEAEMTHKEAMQRLIPSVGIEEAEAVLAYEGIHFPV